MTVAAHENETKHTKHHVHEDALLTVSEVAEILRVDATTTRRWIKNSVLTAVSLPHQGKRQSYRIRQSELNKILEGTAVTAE